MPDCRARSFITIMIIIALCSLFLRFGIEQLIKAAIASNESSASATLKLISTALENYAKNNQGAFPKSLDVLTHTVPAYLDKDYVKLSPVKGYAYVCPRIDAAGYSCMASPVICKVTGKTNYTITTGGFFISEKCDKKE